MEQRKLSFLLVLLSLICFCSNNAEARTSVSSRTFNVLRYGAHADGITDDSKAFMAAWKAMCASRGAVKLLIPKGNYLVGPLKFTGPCKNLRSIKVAMQGYLKATTNLNRYVTGDDWVEFAWLNRLTLTGPGTFDGQGAVSWPFNLCPKNKNCKVLPTSIKFVGVNNTVVKGIKSLNSKFFHMALVGCKNFQGHSIRIMAPEDSPNTDGIHIDRSSGVTIYNSRIGTGDDCISIGHGNSNVLISGIKCGPGHGISVGSLGRYKDEEDVTRIVVKDTVFSGTTNGVRIKTWQESPASTSATKMTFKNILMKSVANPIIIDQNYCPYASCASKTPSRVKISDISFINVRGTSTTQEAVILRCSHGVPCKNINLQNVHLRYVGGSPTIATCAYAQVSFSGTQVPGSCRQGVVGGSQSRSLVQRRAGRNLNARARTEAPRS